MRPRVRRRSAALPRAWRSLGAEQVAERHPVRSLDGARATGHRGPPEACQSSVRDQVREQQLATPEGAVVAHAQAVVGEPQERPRDALLSRARRDVGVVMLDRDPSLGGEPADAHPGSTGSPGGGRGRPTMGSTASRRSRCRRLPSYAWCVPRSSRSPVCGATLARPSTARANVCFSSAPTARATSPGGIGHRQRQWFRRVAATPSHDRLAGIRASADHACHRVVVARPDAPVVEQEAVGDARQPARGVGVIDGQWLVREVAAGEHDRPLERGEQQVMERRVGQEEPDPSVAQADRWGQGDAAGVCPGRAGRARWVAPASSSAALPRP